MRNSKYSGFTIVELLVVIVVIGVLASIALVSYTGISKKATEATIISDLDNASKKFKLFQIENSGYPTGIELNCTTPITSTNICLKPSPNNQYTLGIVDNSVSSSQTFCVTAKNITNNSRFYLTNDGAPIAGGCPIPAPINFTATTTSGYTVDLSWGAVTNATSYTLQYSTDPSFVNPTPTVVPTTLTTTVTASGLAQGTNYYFRIMALIGDDNSLWSVPSAQAKTYYAATFAYTGGAQTWTVPAGVANSTVSIEVWGAQGSGGAKGGYAKGNLAVTTGQVMNIYVGSKGAYGAGGYNGGGSYGAADAYHGGGGSDVRIGGTGWSNRIIVAGGGGGAFNSDLPGGVGGGTVGGDGGTMSWCSGGKGGTSSAGGSPGVGVNYASSSVGALGTGGIDTRGGSWYGGAGGGGYYGGGGAGVIFPSCYGSAGGGSGYIGGVTGGTMSSGVRSGDGQVIITYR